MPTLPPQLLPILRSPLQAEVFAVLFADPDQEWSLTQLAHQTKASPATVGREINRAARAGLVTVQSVGRTKLASANATSEYFEPLSQLLLLAFGPKRLLAEALDGVIGVGEVYIFGSWAARYRGTPGPAPDDIDLLVIGDPDRTEVYEAVEPLERELRRPIQVTFRSHEQWNDHDDPFVATVRSRHLESVLPRERSA